MPVEYAHALSRSLENAANSSEAEAHVDELVAVLKREGKMRALPAILRELERLQAREYAQKPTLTVTKESDSQKALKELGNHLRSVPEVEIQTDERLVGGWRYTDGDTLVDASYKTALLQLYRRVTTL
ncbi:hypothetical protein CL652_03055 [bacterium]|nr:hypothetical protein [bacterium]|tara:strand:- start:45143 stop:45526 length:384 start_codon:yes stop_codon:yes gene_type:complete